MCFGVGSLVFSVLTIQKNSETYFSAELLSKDHINLMDVEMKFSVPLWRITNY